MAAGTADRYSPEDAVILDFMNFQNRRFDFTNFMNSKATSLP